MRNHFKYGGFDSSDYDIIVSGKETLKAPARDVEFVSILGRNGDYVRDNKRFKNILIPYRCFVGDNFTSRFHNIQAALKLDTGYQRIEDSYDPDVYRMGWFVDAVSSEPGAVLRHGTFDVVFNCKPQRFLKAGEEQIAYYICCSGTFGNSGEDIDDIFSYRVEYMPVTASDNFKASAKYNSSSLGSVLKVAWYTSSKAYISQQSAASGTTQEINTTVPASAAYARISYGRGTTYSSDLYGVKVTNGDVDTYYGDGGILLHNPTGYEARPILRFSGVEGKTITIRNLGTEHDVLSDVCNLTFGTYTDTIPVDRMYVDSMTGNCYGEWFQTVYDLNSYVTITDGNGNLTDFPSFKRGTAQILSEPGIFDTLTIQPGWWSV